MRSGGSPCRALALRAAVLLLLIAACSSGNKPVAQSKGGFDGGDAGGEVAAPPGATGNLEVRVSWLKPPATLLKSPGVNRCGRLREPALKIHSAGGVVGAVVLTNSATTESSSTLAIKLVDCAPTPRVLAYSGAAADLRIMTLDERPMTVKVYRVGDGAGELVATLPLAVVGQSFAVKLTGTGVYRVSPDESGADDAYVVVEPGAVTTDETGVVKLSDLTVGKKKFSVWHPPVRGEGRDLIATGEAEVTANETTLATVVLAAE